MRTIVVLAGDMKSLGSAVPAWCKRALILLSFVVALPVSALEVRGLSAAPPIQFAAEEIRSAARTVSNPPAITITLRAGADALASQAYRIERGQMAGKSDLFWQTDTSVAKFSWGYVTNQDYKTVNSIVDDLVDIVSKNGCLLLNIGPKSDGTIPEHEQEMLLDIGRWLKLNGEAIYGLRPWEVFGEGPTQIKEGAMGERSRKGGFTAEDIRFTTKGKTLYAIPLDWPANGTVTIKSLADGKGPQRIRSVKLGKLRQPQVESQCGRPDGDAAQAEAVRLRLCVEDPGPPVNGQIEFLNVCRSLLGKGEQRTNC